MPAPTLNESQSSSPRFRRLLQKTMLLGIAFTISASHGQTLADFSQKPHVDNWNV